MLRKLMKYEFLATARVMVPLLLTAPALGLGIRCFILWNGGAVPALFGSRALPDVLFSLLAAGTAAAMAAAPLAAFVLMVLRFRGNLLGDEGHLMLTLPVSVHSLVWSKLLVSLAWFLLAGAADAAALCAAAWGRALPAPADEAVRALSAWYGRLGAGKGAPALAEIAVLAVLVLLIQCLRFYAPMALGHSFYENKTLLSVLFFFLIEALFQAGLLLLRTLGRPWLEEMQGRLRDVVPALAVHGELLAGILAALVWGGLLYGLTVGMLRRHPDLE